MVKRKLLFKLLKMLSHQKVTFITAVGIQFILLDFFEEGIKKLQMKRA